jgi:hypothetical protein
VKRKTYRLAVCLSLVLTLLLGSLWIRSYFLMDTLMRTRATLPYDPGPPWPPRSDRGGPVDPSGQGVITASGGITFFTIRNLPDDLSPTVRLVELYFRYFPEGIPDGWHFIADPNPFYPDLSQDAVERTHDPWECSFISKFGFSFASYNAVHWSSSGVVFVTLPLWFVVLCTSILPGHWIMQRVRMRRTTKSDGPRCRNCGYDLRASPGRCPECGTVVETKP